MPYLPHEPDEDFGLRLDRWLGRESRAIALELPHALYAMELLLASGCGAEEALVYIAEGDYGPVSRLFAGAVAEAREGEATLAEALLKVGQASGSAPFAEAMRELVARMETGWDVGRRLGQFAYRNQLYIRRANDAFSHKFREVYLPAYMILALLLPFTLGAVSYFLAAMPDVPQPPSWLVAPLFLASLVLALYMVFSSPPLDRTGMVELYLFLLRSPQTRWVVLGLLLLGVPLGLGLAMGLGGGSPGGSVLTSILSSPLLLLVLLLCLDHFGNEAAEKLEARFRQGLEDTAGYLTGHHALEWSLNESFSNAFLLDLGLVRDRYELGEAFHELARRFPLRTFKRTAVILNTALERGIEVGDALHLLSQGLWEHHLIRFRRRTQNLRDLLWGWVILLVLIVPLAGGGAAPALLGYLLVYLVGVGRL